VNNNTYDGRLVRKWITNNNQEKNH